MINVHTRNPDKLLQLLEEQLKLNVEQQKNLAQQQKNILHLTEQISQMQIRLDLLLHQLYGTKSEKRTTKPSNNEEALIIEATPCRANKTKTVSSRKSRGSCIPKDLPRENIVYDIPSEKQFCTTCKHKLHNIGEAVLEQLEFEPAKFYVKKHIRQKYACRCCQSIYTADFPNQPIDKGLPGAGLLTEVLLNKYQDSLPLYRQQQRFLRHGIELSRSTLCDWVAQCAFLLEPLVKHMKEQVLIPGKRIFTDDTTVPVLDQNVKGKTHTGRLWTYVGGGNLNPLCTVYEYSPTRQKTAPQKFLRGFSGYLQADAYPGYDHLYQTGEVIEVACWAHARRKYTDIVKTVKKPGLANEALDFIGQLYAIERTIKSFTIEQKKHYRRRHSKPILKNFKRWLKKIAATAVPKSPIGKALAYSLNHWRALNNYLLDGLLNIDNNTAERAVKTLVIGRKNYLFAGSHKGAERAAVIYSLIETCKQNNVNPYDYLKDVLTRLPNTLMKDINPLLPYNWMPTAQPDSA